MIETEDLKRIAKVLVPYAVSNEEELINIVFDVTDNVCRGYDIGSYEYYEALVMALVKKAEEDKQNG